MKADSIAYSADESLRHAPPALDGTSIRCPSPAVVDAIIDRPPPEPPPLVPLASNVRTPLEPSYPFTDTPNGSVLHSVLENNNGQLHDKQPHNALSCVDLNKNWMNTAPSCYSNSSPFSPDVRFQEATPCVLGLDDDSAWSRPRVLRIRQPSDLNSRLRCDPTYKLPRVLKSTALDEVMWDPGANICITSNLHILQNLTPTTPFPVGLAVSSDSSSVNTSLCTMKGYLMLPLMNGQFHPQVCYYNAMASDTIISPQAICADSDGRLTRWSMSGNSDKAPGNLILSNDKDSYCVSLDLYERNGLWYCSADTLSNPSTSSYPTAVAAHVDSLADASLYWTSSLKIRTDPSVLDEMWTPLILRTSRNTNATERETTSNQPRKPTVRRPTSKARQLESELWSARLGYPSEWQLEVLPKQADGLPTQFYPHPFSKHETKMSADIQRAAAGKKPTLVAERGRRFHADYGFMRASSVNYSRPSKETDRVVKSFDGFNCYLLIVDEVSRFVWVFLCSSKEPPIDIMSDFLRVHGHAKGGLIRTDQGGELARSFAFRQAMLNDIILMSQLRLLMPTLPHQMVFTLWNQRVLIHLRKTVVLKNGMILLLLLPGCYCTVPVCHQNIGRLHSAMQYTSTTTEYMLSRRRHLLKHGMVSNLV